MKPATLGERAYCIKCGYQLSGLPQDGACPECGEEYDPLSVAKEPAPMTANLLLRFGWPMALYLLFTVVPMTGMGDGSFILPVSLILLAASFLACIFNVPVQYRLLNRRDINLGPRAEQNRRLMVTLGVLSILWPFLVFGGCLWVVMTVA